MAETRDEARTNYVVTESAPPRVNGRKVKPGDVLPLTEAEALYERDLGHILLKTAPPAEAAEEHEPEGMAAKALSALVSAVTPKS